MINNGLTPPQAEKRRRKKKTPTLEDLLLAQRPAEQQHFPHQADIGVRGIGHTKSEAFEQAALALTSVVTDTDNVAPLVESSFHCEAPDDDLLLAEWLNALIYEMATKHRLFSRFQVTLMDGSLDGRAWGEPVDVRRHEPAVEIKGATYTALSVRQGPEGWIAACVVDV